LAAGELSFPRPEAKDHAARVEKSLRGGSFPDKKSMTTGRYLKLILYYDRNYAYLVRKPWISWFVIKNHIMKKDTLEYRMMQENNRLKISEAKLQSGSLIGKYPVILDGGKTTIFITDKSKEAETRQNYESRMSNRFMLLAKKPK
jgi:hypothetical protein